MLFSFLMCVHQDQPFLDQAMRSMIYQDYGDEYEIIVVANNCTDELYEKLYGYLEVSDRIRLYRTSIGQLAFNLNYGVDKARGKYIARMDADDVCFPDRLSLTLSSLEKHDFPDVLGGCAQLIDDSGRVIGQLSRVNDCDGVKRDLAYRNPIVHPATVIRRESIFRVRGYLGGINCEDYDLWLRMDRSEMRLLVDNFLAIKYRVNSFQVKGSRIAYADGVGLKLREGLYRGSGRYYLGALLGFFKFHLFLLLKKMK